MEDNKNVEIVEEEIVEKPAEKKGLKKVTEFFQKPIVKKIVTGIAVAGAAIIGYAVGAVGGSNGEGSCEESGYLPEPDSGSENETEIGSEDDSDCADDNDSEE